MVIEWITDKFIPWFFDSPSPIIAFVSVSLAFVVYLYQRAEKKKHLACSIANKYAVYFLPRIRYIGKVLQLANVTPIISRFEEADNYDEKELKRILNGQQSSIEDLKNKIASVNKEELEMALCYSGNPSYMIPIHTHLAENIDKDFYLVFSKFVLDMLNELEGEITALRYNIADEKLVYQSLHQTYLNHMKNWYFFIAYENTTDESQYFFTDYGKNEILKKKKKYKNLLKTGGLANHFSI